MKENIDTSYQPDFSRESEMIKDMYIYEEIYFKGLVHETVAGSKSKISGTSWLSGNSEVNAVVLRQNVFVCSDSQFLL